MKTPHQQMLDTIKANTFGARGWLLTPIKEFRFWLAMQREARYVRTGKRPYSSLREHLSVRIGSEQDPFHPGWADPLRDIDPKMMNLARSSVAPRPGKIILVSNPDGREG